MQYNTFQITTTYGDYLDGVIYLNKFILSRYPQIILQKQGEPYDSRFENVNSGYLGAIKMTVLEELIHSAQENLQQVNRRAAVEVNKINEELANIMLIIGYRNSKQTIRILSITSSSRRFSFCKKSKSIFLFES